MQPRPILTVFDLDNTLAQQSEDHIRPVFYRFLHQEVIQHQPQSFDAFMVEMNILNKRGLGTYGWAERLGFTPQWAENLHHRMSPVLAAAVLENLKPDAEVISRLSKLEQAGHQLAIFTHGHAEYALPVAEHLGLSRFFPPHNVFDITTNNGTLKTSVESYHYVLNKLEAANGAPFQKRIMVEDNGTNLVAAKQAGFQTVLLGSEYLLPNLHEVVDNHFPALIPALDSLLDA